VAAVTAVAAAAIRANTAVDRVVRPGRPIDRAGVHSLIGRMARR